MTGEIPAQERLIVALDVDGIGDALRLVDVLGAEVRFYKIGLQLFMEGGLTAVRRITERGKKVFLDLKVDDTPRTIQEAVRNASVDGVEFFTLQGNGDTVRAAVAGRGARARPRFLQITYLSSWDATDLAEQLRSDPAHGPLSIDDQVVHRTRRILEWGCDGVIASGSSVQRLRREFPQLLIVTPGIRPAGSATDDHKRSMTPAEAIRAGADYLVVGRPIRAARDPRGSALRIQEDIAQALRSEAA